MSKRSGEFITLDELLAEIGVDAARWFFAARGHTVGIDFDIELAKTQSAENPVYYVQYAHARIASLLRKGGRRRPDAGRLAGRLARRRPGRPGPRHRVLRLPEVVEDARRGRGDAGVDDLRHRARHDVPCLLPRPAGRRRRRPDDVAARLALVDATRLALANALP